MRRQRKPSVTYTCYATPSLRVLAPHSLSPCSLPDLRTHHHPLLYFHLCFLLSLIKFFLPHWVSSLPHLISAMFAPSPPLQACENTCFLRPVVCASVCVCEYESVQVLMWAHACVQSYILAGRRGTECFSGLYQVESRQSLMLRTDLSTGSKALRNAECQYTLHSNIVSLQSFAFQSDVLLLNSRGVEAVGM